MNDYGLSRFWGEKDYTKSLESFVLVLILPVTNHVTYLQNPFLGFCSFICKMKDIWPDILYSLRSTLSYSVGNSLINSLLILFILDDFSNCNGTTCLPFNRLIRSKKASYMSFSHPLFYWLAHLLLPSIKETKHLLVIIILNKQVRNFFKEKDAKIAFEFYKILRVLKWNPRSLCWRRYFAGNKGLRHCKWQLYLWLFSIGKRTATCLVLGQKVIRSPGLSFHGSH